MTGLVDIYWTLFKTSLAEQFQYRAAMVIWLLGLILHPVIYLVVWLTVARTQGGQVGGFTGADFAAYYIVLMVVNHLTFTWNMFEFEFRVRTGEFSPVLLQPLHPIHRDIGSNLSYKVLTMVVVVPTAIFLVLVFDPVLAPPRWAIVAFVPSLLLAFGVRFLVEWCLALAAFWTTRVTALNQLYFAALLFLGGRMAPLELMPGWVRVLSDVSPFRWMLAFPVELLLGRLSPDQALRGLLVQAAWTGAGLGLLALVWGRGVKRYSAVGS